MNVEQLRVAEQHIADIEDAIQSSIEVAAERLRLQLLSMLTLGTLTGTAIRAAGDELRAEVEQTMREIMPNLLDTANGYVTTELTELGELLDEDIDLPRVDTTQVVELAIAAALSWIEALIVQLIIEAEQLELQNAPLELRITRMFQDYTADGERASAWTLGLLAMGTAIASAVWGAWNNARDLIYRELEHSSISYRRQAVAAIDKRTTRCCLAVHGQIVGIDQPFTLTGTPRYASKLMSPPFHWRCRTSVVLYHEAFERVGQSTEQMRRAAKQELAQR